MRVFFIPCTVNSLRNWITCKFTALTYNARYVLSNAKEMEISAPGSMVG